MNTNIKKDTNKEEIAVLIDSLDKGTDTMLWDWVNSEALFDITAVYSLKRKDVGKYLRCGLYVENLSAIRNEKLDDIIVYTEDFKKQKQMLVKEYGISKEKIADKTAVIFWPAESFTGSISVDSAVQTDCLVDVNYLFRNGYLHCQNDFERFYFGEGHRPIHKWFHYFEIYEKLFSEYRGKKVKILEIGVFKGGSLQMWKNYFGEDATIVGVDIDPICKSFEEEGIHIEIGSQEDRVFLKGLLEKYGLFDIVLDDGGHTMKQQITSFDVLYRGVKWGGIYVCEDCHTSYWRRDFKGGYKRKGTFIEFMKERVDDLNAQYIKRKYIPDAGDRISTKFKYSRFVNSILRHIPRCILRATGLYNIRFKSYANVVNKVWSVQFYDSIVALVKRKTGRAFDAELLR